MARLQPAPVVPYGEHSSHVANLHLPSTTRPRATIVLLHGGFWRARWDRTLMTPLAVDLARRGYAAWNVEFRRVGEAGGGWPGTVDDVRRAVDAVVANDDLRARPIVLLGHSAGGHLALVAAAGSSDVAAVFALASICDLEQARGLDPSAVDEFLGGPPEQLTERLRAASPRSLVPLGVRQVLVHGEADDIVPPAMSARYADAAREAGDEVELVLLPGVDHFDVIDPGHPAWHEVVARLDDALRSSHAG